MKKDFNNYAEAVSQNIYITLEKAKKYHRNYSLMGLLSATKGLSEKDIDCVLEILLSEYIKLLKPIYACKPIFDDDKFQNEILKIESLIDYFYSDKDCECDCEGDFIVADLLNKAIGKNNRSLELPINIFYVREYLVGNSIDQKEVTKVIVFAILKLHIMYYLMK